MTILKKAFVFKKPMKFVKAEKNTQGMNVTDLNNKAPQNENGFMWITLFLGKMKTKISRITFKGRYIHKNRLL